MAGPNGSTIKKTNNYIIWLVVICILLVIYYMDLMWSLSSDLGEHYTLAYRISEQWALHGMDDPSLGLMIHYPPISHMIAAVIGCIVHSTFLGIQITTLSALALLWLGIIFILNSLQIKLAIFSLLTFVLIVLLNAISLKLDIHGHEIVGNFFYAQLVGQSVLFFGICIAIHLEKNRGIFSSLFFLMGLIFIEESIYLLSALQGLGLLFGLLCIYPFKGIAPNKTIEFKLLTAIGFAFFSTLIFVWHPSFTIMKNISQNDGSLHMHGIHYPDKLILMCISVIIISLILLSIWIKSASRTNNIAIKYLALYGASTAGLCLLQFLLKKFGYGSDYAVKKYVFALVTILFLDIALLVGNYLSRIMDSKSYFFENKMYSLRGVVFGLSLCLLYISSVSAIKMLDVSDVVTLERKLIALNDTLIPPAESGKNNVMIGLGNRTIDYIFSIAIAKTLHEVAWEQYIGKNDIQDLSKYANIISTHDNYLYGAAGCDSLSTGSLSIVKPDCVKQKIEKAQHCNAGFDFSRKGHVLATSLNGFSDEEKNGRWTDGYVAEFSCSRVGQSFKQVILYLSPFIAGKIKTQRLVVSINNQPLGEFELGAVKNHSIILSIPDHIKESTYHLIFKIPNAISPKDLGLSDDSRQLGFMFESMTFQ